MQYHTHKQDQCLASYSNHCPSVFTEHHKEANRLTMSGTAVADEIMPAADAAANAIAVASLGSGDAKLITDIAKRCSKCKELIDGLFVQVQAANELTGAKDQFHCKECDNTYGKLKRWFNKDEEAKIGWKKMSTEEKAQAMKDIRGLEGDKLKMKFMQSVTNTSFKRHF